MPENEGRTRVKMPTHGGFYYAIRNAEGGLEETGFVDEETDEKYPDAEIDTSSPAATVPVTAGLPHHVFDGDKGRSEPHTRDALAEPGES